MATVSSSRMSKYQIVGVGLFGILFVGLLVSFINTISAANHAAEIAKLTIERERAVMEREKLEQEIESRDRQIGELQGERTTLLAEIEANGAEIERLATLALNARTTVRSIRTSGALVEAFRDAFPEFAGATGIGVVDILDEGNGVTIEYATLPVWILDAVIGLRIDGDSCREQIALHEANEGKYGSVVDLSTQVERLERENRESYRRGFESAESRYQDLNARYIEQLGKPRIDIGSKWSFLAGSLVGFGVCSAVDVQFRF